MAEVEAGQSFLHSGVEVKRAVKELAVKKVRRFHVYRVLAGRFEGPVRGDNRVFADLQRGMHRRVRAAHDVVVVERIAADQVAVVFFTADKTAGADDCGVTADFATEGTWEC